MSSKRSGHRYFRSKELAPIEILDPAIERALDYKYVDNVQVAEAYEIRQQVYRLGVPEPAWRCLATVSGIDKDKIYSAAAEVYDYRRFSRPPKMLVPFMRRIISSFTDEQWRGMATVPIVPIRRLPNSFRPWTFAAHDPTSREAHEFARTLTAEPYVMYQADRAVIARLLAEVFLSKMEIPVRRRKGKTPKNKGKRSE